MTRRSSGIRLRVTFMASLAAAVIAATASVPIATATAAITPDPYSILDCYVAGMGGWERLKGIQTRHSVGTLTIEGAGLSGSVEEWDQSPAKKRQAVDLKVIKQVSGDNGEVAWRIDPNGRLVIDKDPEALKDRELSGHLAANENLERGSKLFTVTYARRDTADGRWCHVLKTTNSINSTVTYDYYDTTSCRLVQTVAMKPAGESHSFMKDYREVDGVFLPFRVESLELPTRQRVTVQLTTVELNGPIDSLLFEPPAGQGHDFRFPPGQASVEVPFQFIELHIYLPLTIGGQTRLWVLDSGASASVVEAGFAREIGLQTEGKITGQGANNTVDVSFATLPPFALNGVSFDSQKVVAIALNDLFRKTGGFEIGGILGYDFLSRLVTRVDYAHQMLTFFDPDSFRYTGDGSVLAAPLTRNNMLQIKLTVDGRYTGPWNLDLGAGGLDFFYPYAEQNGLLGRTGIQRAAFGAGGGQISTTAQFETVEFAGFTMKKMQIGIPRERGTGVFAAGEITGNAGNDLFRHFVLYLDYTHDQVIVEKGSDFATDFPTDKSGLQLLLGDDGRMFAYTVAEGSPAAQAGIKEGDVVTAIDGKDLQAIGGVIKARELFRAPAGTRYALDLLRNGKPVQLTMTLGDLYR
jgi:hypothetical protein